VPLITIHSYKHVLAAVVVAIEENRYAEARKISMNLCGSVSPFVLIVDLLEKDIVIKKLKR